MLKTLLKSSKRKSRLEAYIDHPVEDRLFVAEKRLRELEALNGGSLAGASHRDRQALVQEFFFHLTGAIEFLAQEINLKKSLGLLEHQVTPKSVAELLDAADPIRKVLLELHPDTKGQLPADPYSEDGSHFRIIVFRNFVTHIRHNPFFFRLGSFPAASLRLDPRLPADHPGGNGSIRPVFEDLELFHQLVLQKCRIALGRP
jgi:hypothetical protein